MTINLPWTTSTTERVADIPRDAWNKLLPERPEDHGFFLAAEMSPPEGFAFGLKTVRCGDEIVALAPTFQTIYALPITDIIDKPWAQRIKRKGQPAKLNIAIQGLGSPLTDNCPIGLAAHLSVDDATVAMRRLLAFEKPKRALEFVVAKDVSQAMFDRTRSAWLDERFAPIATLPTIRADVKVPTVEAFLASRPQRARRFLKRWQRDDAAVSIRQTVGAIDDAAMLYDMYCEQQRASKVDSGPFDGIAPTFMQDVVQQKPGETLVMTFHVGETLAGFAFNYFNAHKFVSKFVGFRQPLARDHGLYIRYLLAITDFAIARGIPVIELGQSTYRTKTTYGGQMHRNYLMVRHPNGIANAVLKRLAPKLSFEAMDEELAQLRAEGIVPL
jgi:hypothetical protein